MKNIILITHFQHPLVLISIVVIIAILVINFWMGRKHDEQLLAYSQERNWKSLGIKKREIVRIIPSLLALGALLALICAAAGPMGQTLVPRSRATLVIAFDTSQSMRATDVPPSRLQAAKKIVTDLLDTLAPGISVGLVSFDASAAGVVNPTTNHNTILLALNSLKLGDGTATGAAINEARRMIQKYNADLGGPEIAQTAQVLLISDGKQTAPGFDPESEGGYMVAARAAGSEDIPINTIAVGTTNGSITIDGETISVPVDRYALAKIAQLSGGQNLSLYKLDNFSQILSQLSTHIGYEKREQPFPLPLEYTALLLLICAIASGLIINRHIF